MENVIAGTALETEEGEVLMVPDFLRRQDMGLRPFRVWMDGRKKEAEPIPVVTEPENVVMPLVAGSRTPFSSATYDRTSLIYGAAAVALAAALAGAAAWYKLSNPQQIVTSQPVEPPEPAVIAPTKAQEPDVVQSVPLKLPQDTIQQIFEPAFVSKDFDVAAGKPLPTPDINAMLPPSEDIPVAPEFPVVKPAVEPLQLPASPKEIYTAFYPYGLSISEDFDVSAKPPEPTKPAVSVTQTVTIGRTPCQKINVKSDGSYDLVCSSDVLNARAPAATPFPKP